MNGQIITPKAVMDRIDQDIRRYRGQREQIASARGKLDAAAYIFALQNLRLHFFGETLAPDSPQKAGCDNGARG